MTDILTSEQRSYCMSRVKGKDTKPELILRKALWHRGLRYRLNRKLPGRPDMVFVSARLGVFVDGCFWHACPIHGSFPKSNRPFWEKKIKGNIDRDRRVNGELATQGWLVVRIWEHEIKQNPDEVAKRITDVV